MDTVISERDDSVVDMLFYFKPVQRCEYRVICSVFGFQLLREQGRSAVTGDENTSYGGHIVSPIL